MGRVTEITKRQVLPRIVERPSLSYPQAELGHLFKVTGKVLITDIVGELTGISSVFRVDTMTITGTGGTATILCDGVSNVLTFVAAISTSIDTFITANAAAYLAGGVAITKSGTDKIVFTSTVRGLNFTGNTTGVNASGDLAGTVAATYANACLVKLVANPTVGADVDLCADLDIIAGATGSTLNITGTLANAMVKTAGGAGLSQAAPILVKDGYIDLNTVVPVTGTCKWFCHYVPIDVDSKVEAVIPTQN